MQAQNLGQAKGVWMDSTQRQIQDEVAKYLQEIEGLKKELKEDVSKFIDQRFEEFSEKQKNLAEKFRQNLKKMGGDAADYCSPPAR